MKLSSVKKDLNAAENGVVFPIKGGGNLRIAQWGNKKHQAFITELVKKHGRKIEMGVLSNAQSDRLLNDQWPHILKDFSGITDDDGNEIKYSPEFVIELANNPQYEEFFKNIETIAKDEANYREENIKALGES